MTETLQIITPKKSGNFRNITGQRFWDRVTAIRLAGREGRHLIWECKCDCGNLFYRPSNLVTAGHTKSCGCLKSTKLAERNRTHGETAHGKASKEYRAWATMLRRCSDKKFVAYPDYGGRGIKVCERWLTFDNFLSDMGRAPSSKHTLGRENPDEDYCSENCRWETKMEQGRGKRNNRLLEFNGRKLTIAEWTRETGLPVGAIAARLEHGWSVDEAISLQEGTHRPVPKKNRVVVNKSYDKVKHGKSRTKEYGAWNTMIQRCYNASNKRYSRYGARGIIVCERWRNSFENFLADMGPAPSSAHTLDRKDNNDNYCPENCQWATKEDQAANRSTNHLLTHNGETFHIAEWSRRTGIPRSAILARLRYGWTVERTLTQPLRTK